MCVKYTKTFSYMIDLGCKLVQSQIYWIRGQGQSDVTYDGTFLANNTTDKETWSHVWIILQLKNEFISGKKSLLWNIKGDT